MQITTKPKLFLGMLLLLPAVAWAQPGANRPPLLDCGMQGNAEVICDTRAPEDFEVTPDGRFLIVANFGQGEDAPLDLFDLETHSFTEILLDTAPLTGWGETTCAESLGAQITPHGLSLSQRATGQWQLYVVNHSLRESIEMYELVQDGEVWNLVWHGCVVAQEPYNDVAVQPDGSFVATRPQALQTEGQNLFAGGPSGNVARWNQRTGEEVLPGTAYGYPNGVLVSGDGRYAYVSGWTTSDFHQYDLSTSQETGRVDLGFMPDNLTWTPDGKILAAGIKGIAGNCPEESTFPCIQGFVVAEVDPATLEVSVVYDSAGQALINGTSVAIEVDGKVYVGAFQGERLVIVPR